MTLEEFLKFFFDNKSRIKAPLQSEITEDYNEAIAHTRGVNLGYLLKEYRIKEDLKKLERRSKLLTPLTKDRFDRATDGIVETLNRDLVKIDAPQEVEDLVRKNKFFEFLFTRGISNMIDDPNGYHVILPNKTINPDGTVGPLEYINYLVNYKDVVNDEKVDGYLVFERNIVNKTDYSERKYYYFISNQEIGRFYKGENAYVKDDSYYFFYDKPSPVKFYRKLGGKITRGPRREEYFKSYFYSAFGHGTLGIRRHSDGEVGRMWANTVSVTRQVPCTECNESLRVPNPADPDGPEITCPTCRGTGKKDLSWQIGDVLAIRDDEMNDYTLDDVIKFIEPPRESVVLNFELAKQAFEDLEKALNMIYVDEAQSGTAKDIDREQYTAMINHIAKNVYHGIVKHYYEVLCFNLGEDPEKVTIKIPDDFRKITAESVLEQITEQKAAGASTGVLYPLFLRLYSTMFNDDPISKKIAIFGLVNDPLHIYGTIAEKRLASASDEDFEYSKRLYPTLYQILNEVGSNEAFVKLTNEELVTRVKSKMVIPKQKPEYDNNGNLIAR